MNVVTRYYIHAGGVTRVELKETERQFRLLTRVGFRTIFQKDDPHLFEDEQAAINELISKSRLAIETKMREIGDLEVRIGRLMKRRTPAP